MSFIEGELAPVDNPNIGIEYARSVFSDGGVHVVYYITDYSTDDIVMFSDAPIQYGIFSKDHCPFLVFQFTNSNWSFEASFNILLEEEDTGESFINGTENNVSLILVDSGSNMVKAIREINMIPEVLIQIRNDLINQKKIYNDANSAQLAYDQLENKFAVGTKMLILSQKNQLHNG